MKGGYKKYILNFKNPSGTSRGTLVTKETWFLILQEHGKFGIGECGLFRGLSYDDVPDYEQKLQWLIDNITKGEEYLLKELRNYPSIQFGLEQAFLSLKSNSPFELFDSSFLNQESPIPINGLVWMGDEKFMHNQIQDKIAAGFKCIKMKIGALDFQREFGLLQSIRKEYTQDEVELRVDANGAFLPEEALAKLNKLAELNLHSIEQPIKAGSWDVMKQLCLNSPLPIALDEELIGVLSVTEKEKLLQTIKPQYIILKPSLVGGCKGSWEWITLAEKYGIGWWITSALESNIGLNAIAQWTATLKNNIPQGLGTGSLFTNNFESPLTVKNGSLYYRKNKNWKENLINELCT